MPCMIITLMSIVYLSFHHLLSPLKVLGNSGDQQDWSQGLWGDFHTKGKMGSYIFKTSDHSFTSFMDHLALLFFSAKKKNQKHRFLGLESLLLFWMDYWLCWWWEKHDLCVGSTEERKAGWGGNCCWAHGLKCASGAQDRDSHCSTSFKRQ